MSFVLKSHMVRAFRCIMLGSKDLEMWSFNQVDAKAKVIWINSLIQNWQRQQYPSCSLWHSLGVGRFRQSLLPLVRLVNVCYIACVAE